jgi:hypothetical protein
MEASMFNYTCTFMRQTLLVLLSAVFISACNSGSGGTESDINTASNTTNNTANNTNTAILQSLSTAEAEGLVYMREEEKLARDVYIAMYDLGYSEIFNNISSSEQSHTDAVLSLLEKYNITDPVGGNAEGEFTNPDLQKLYDDLILLGAPSLIEALYVGAAIEEIDIIDIQQQLDTVVDNADIATVYENLIKGSRNHLRAFVSNLAKQGVDYQPQYLSQEVFDDIINSPMENGQL